MSRFTWGDGEALQLTFAFGADECLRIEEVVAAGVALRATHPAPFFEITTAAAGRTPSMDRLTHSQLGAALRYVSHRESESGGERMLEIVAEAPGLTARARLRMTPGVAAVTSEVSVTAHARQVLLSVASWSSDPGGHSQPNGVAGEDDVSRWSLLHGRNDWLAEGRWRTVPLRDAGLVPLRADLTGVDPRGSLAVLSTGSWSTGGRLPVGGLIAPDAAILWQIEHNGAWRWDIGEDTGGASLTLSGPTDRDHGWIHALEPGEEFRSVPVTVAFGADLMRAGDAMTSRRRARRRPHPDNAAMPVIFNDYMNTLNGDPTTARLLPLIDAASAVGAEIFCIDAGWYDESALPGGWWSSVGEWRPSSTRFPGGLGEVVDRIRERGMVPGLWLEPEVIGVDSPLAGQLPPEAFLSRLGVRVQEHERFHLDFRHPAARAHLDSTIDRLIADLEIGFFKFDYNIDAGAGTDRDADSVGAGLLGHNRAYLAWLDALHLRHPSLVIESCSSGAMRGDWAVMSRLQLQSSSDQQDFRLAPPIAATAPMMVLPEQAASWAYPQPGMTEEEIAFCLVTGLLGRFYLSGYLNRMSPAQLALVQEAVSTAKSLRAAIAHGFPRWPLGLPDWTDDAVAFGLSTGDELLVSIWHRAGKDDIVLELPDLRGREIRIEQVFPARLTQWGTQWRSVTGRLTLTPTAPTPTARTLRIRHRPAP